MLFCCTWLYLFITGSFWTKNWTKDTFCGNSVSTKAMTKRDWTQFPQKRWLKGMENLSKLKYMPARLNKSQCLSQYPSNAFLCPFNCLSNLHQLNLWSNKYCTNQSLFSLLELFLVLKNLGQIGHRDYSFYCETIRALGPEWSGRSCGPCCFMAEIAQR